jgi:hypothetical protein
VINLKTTCPKYDNVVVFRTALANLTSININAGHVRGVLNFFSAEYNQPTLTLKRLKAQEDNQRVLPR